MKLINVNKWLQQNTSHLHSPYVACADYYPFGLTMSDREITTEPYRFGYQGQYSEEESETGWNSFDFPSQRSLRERRKAQGRDSASGEPEPCVVHRSSIRKTQSPEAETLFLCWCCAKEAGRSPTNMMNMNNRV